MSRNTMYDTNRFRILSIDGGGIKGVFPAAFLATLEDALDSPIHRYFDLIAGTSTGGIIALGLGFGVPAKRLLEFYLRRGPDIFPAKAKKIRKVLRNFFSGPKYQPSELRGALEEVFGESTLQDSQVRLLIPTLNAASGRIHIYKTPHHPRLELDRRVRAVDVALATSAAPTYLPAHISPEGAPFLDGGLYANNPTGMAAIEAVTMLNVKRSNIEVLSLGCTTEPKDFTAKGNGQLAWALAAIQAAMCGQSFYSMGAAALLIGHDHITRIDPHVKPGRFALDKTDGIEHLRAFGYEEARHAIPNLRRKFFSETAPIYIPCSMADRSENTSSDFRN